MVPLFACRYWATIPHVPLPSNLDIAAEGLPPELGLDTASGSGIVWTPRRLRGPRKEIGRPWKPVEGAEACYRASSRAQPSGGVLGTDPDRPHRSRALHGAVLFGEVRSCWIRDGKKRYDASDASPYTDGGVLWNHDIHHPIPVSWPCPSGTRRRWGGSMCKPATTCLWQMKNWWAFDADESSQIEPD